MLRSHGADPAHAALRAVAVKGSGTGGEIEVVADLLDSVVAGSRLADTLAEVASHCTELVGAAAAGIVAADPRWGPRLLAAAPQSADLDGLFGSHPDEGPAVEVLDRGSLLTADLRTSGERWPAFAPAARALGYEHVLALPVRMDGEALGTLGIFGDGTRPPTRQDVLTGQVMADIAALALVQEAGHRRFERAAERVQGLLNERGTVEQAKGAIGARLACSPDEAHGLLAAVAGELGASPATLAHRVLSGESAVLVALAAAHKQNRDLQDRGGYGTGSAAQA